MIAASLRNQFNSSNMYVYVQRQILNPILKGAEETCLHRRGGAPGEVLQGWRRCEGGGAARFPIMANFFAIGSSSSFRCLPRSSDLQACALRLRLAMLVAACIITYDVGVADGAGGPTGSCADLNGGVICDPPYCCSKSQYCQPKDSATSCGKDSDCLVDYSSIGACDGDTRTGTSPPGSSSDVCGRLAGNKKCDNNLCCSKDGQCGTSSAYCYKGCQSQCRYTPAQIAGITLGAMTGLAILCAVAFGIYMWYRRKQGRKPITRKDIVPVHRLYPTDGTAKDKDTCLDIVFCHGLAISDLQGNAWKNTWLTRQTPGQAPLVCWAEEWLGEDLQGMARVFSLEYDGNVSSDPSKKGSNSDVSEIAKNLLQCIFGAGFEIGQSNPVVLIGHSFGGLVIKSLVVEAQRLAQHNPRADAVAKAHARSCQIFLNNIADGGFIFYAVPHSGAQNLEVYIRNCDDMLKRNKRRDNSPGLLSNIHVFSRDMETLSVKFESFVRTNNERNNDVIIYAFTEGLPMTRENLGIIVEHGSAVRLSGNNYYKVESANHMTVCRPETRNDESYKQLVKVLKLILDNRSKEAGRSDLEKGGIDKDDRPLLQY